MPQKPDDDIKPPFSTLTAYDLNQGTIKWQILLGEMSALVAKGVRNTGSNIRGGVVVTAGGLIFAGTQGDQKLRAFDKDTGAVLWEKQLPARPDGVPAVFEVAGREYIVICAKEPDSVPNTDVVKPVTAQGYYVFALPVAGPAAAGGR